MRKKIASFVLATMLMSTVIPQMPVKAASFNYGEALQKSLMFYEFQRSGELPEDKRDNWRGDSALTDGADVGADLTGGWFDAGDHVKFNLPMAYTVSMLAWSMYENKDAYQKSGQLKYAMDNIRWAADYLKRCHIGPNKYAFQVGTGTDDHNWWGPAEVMTMKRPTYVATTSNPASTVVAQSAAALAATSVVFKDEDPEFAADCLKHAKELLKFAEDTKSDAGYGPAENFYRSHSSFGDELSWASIWIYLAEGDSSYIEKCESYIPLWKTEMGTKDIAYKWAHCWDDVHIGTALLLARITKKDSYNQLVEKNLDWCTTGYAGEKVKTSAKGLICVDVWGTLRYATTQGFIADLYSDWSGCTDSKVSTYRDFAKSQLDIALGSTGRSYVVGYGVDYPQHPHHRTAHGSWGDNFQEPAQHKHILYGALVGGPDSDGVYKDDTNDYVYNEVACDYNAGFTALNARMYQRYGGEPIEGFNAIEEKQPEAFVSGAATVNTQGQIDIKVKLFNKSAWPARALDKLSFRYYIDLSEVYAAGKTVSDVSSTMNYSEGGKIAGIFPFDEANHIYYVLVDFTGVKIVPGGATSFRKEAQFVIASNSGLKLDIKNDFSYDGFGEEEANLNIPVFDDGKMITGVSPDGTMPSEAPGNTPKPTPTKIPSQKPSATPSYPHIPDDVSSVEGYVCPEFFTEEVLESEQRAGFKVEIEGTSLSAISDETGRFSIPNIKLSSSKPTFTVKISKPGFLTRRIENLTGGGYYQIPKGKSWLMMWAGDIANNGVQDDSINMQDVMQISKVFNTTASDAKFKSDCDLNGDKVVNMADVILIAKRFNKISSDYEPVDIGKIAIA